MRFTNPPPEKPTIPRPPKNDRRTIPLWAVLAALGLLSVMVLGAFGWAAYYVYQLTQTTELTFVLDNQTRTVNTRARTVEELIASLDLSVSEGDRLSLALDQSVEEGMLLRMDRARPVVVNLDGVSQVHYTPHTNPSDILSALNLTLGQHDYIALDGTRADPNMLRQWPVPVNQMTIRRAVTVTLREGDHMRDVETAAATVGEMLHAEGVVLYVADSVQPALEEALSAGMTVNIERAKPLTVIADRQTLDVRVQADTVGPALVEVGVLLQGLDYSIPGELVQVQPGMSVRVIRVREDIISEAAVVPHSSSTQLDPSLELDQVRIVEPGENGLTRTDTRVRYENGVEISRESLGTNTVRQPTDRVVAYGAGVVLRSIQTEQGPREYWRKLRLLTTSYHPAALGGDNITATGQVLTKGIVGVDPTVIPYGTQLYIPGYGIGVAADTGGPRSTRLWIDLGYDDENWIPWSQYTDVYVLTPVPGNIQYILPD